MNRANPRLSAFLLTVLLGALVVTIGASADGGTPPGGAAIAPPSTVVSTAEFLTLQLPAAYRVAAAVGLALLLWVVFPLPVGLLCRAHLAGQPSLAPDERLRVYQCWQRRIQWTTAIGGYLTLTVLWMVMRPPRLQGGYVSLAAWWLWFWCGAAMRLTGLPLYRDADSASSKLTLLGALRGVIWVIIAPVFVVPLYELTGPGNSAFGNAQLPVLIGRMLALLGIILLAAFVPLLWRVIRQRPQRVPPPEVPDDPEALRATLRELAERAEKEREAPEPTIPVSPGLNAQATTHAAEMLRALRELEPAQ
jgi:VanZ family protein